MSTETNMALLTCIVDATTLVNRIHEIKQWVYDESINLHIPICTFEKVEQIYKASLQPKEVPKEIPTKKPLSGKANRKETPLFDINPRTTMEFLERSRGVMNSHRVTFQHPQELFTQWKEEEEKAIKAAQQPQGPPATFAQAVLLSKLNFTPENSDVKAAAKPKLVARSSSPKSPWKYHKVPIIPTVGIPQHLKPLMSCVLWRLHEFDNNPLMPETFVLLSDDGETVALAVKLNVPHKNTLELRASIKEKQPASDLRESFGALEVEFPSKALVDKEDRDSETPAAELAPTPPNAFDIGTEEVLEPDDDIEELKKSISSEKEVINIIEKPILQVQAPTPSLLSGDFSTGIEEKVMPTAVDSIDEPAVVQEMATLRPETLAALLQLTNITESGPVPPEPVEEPKREAAETVLLPEIEKKDVVVNPEEDSDEEVVVFKPRSRRISGLPKTAGESSRPTTANGSMPATVNVSRPATANGTDKSKEIAPSNSLPLPYGGSQLKPQSPVFVPKTLHSAGKHIPNLPNEVVVEVSEVAAVRPYVQAQPAAQSPRRGPNPNPHVRRIDGLAQRQSRDIIERQREAIQRQAQLAAKPPVRQIQMQPTSSPTVIDPDAFDRSYVVKPVPSPSPSSGAGSHHRGHHRHNSPQHNATNVNYRGHNRRVSPAAVGTENNFRGTGRRTNSPPNGVDGTNNENNLRLSPSRNGTIGENNLRLSPSRNGNNGSNRGQNCRESPPNQVAEAAEPEVDFVLKSGTPRAATRGRGKLWVP